VRGPLPGREIRESDILSAYLFYGEELFPAEQFIRDLERVLASPDDQGVAIEKFASPETPWRDILDLARTISFFFSPWRLFVVEIDPQGRSTKEDDEDQASWDLTPVEQQVFKEYFESPTPKTVLIVIFRGKIRKTSLLFKLFAALPKSAARVEELKPLKKERLFPWVDETLAALGKRASSEAIDRLFELAGTNLQQLNSELQKLVTYVGDKKMIEVGDVNFLSSGVREFETWDLANSLEKFDLDQALIILNRRFQEGDRPEQVLFNLVTFCRDLLAAKAGLAEKRDRKDIFKEIRPGLSAQWGDWYWEKQRSFFEPVEKLSEKEIVRLVTQLEQIDLKIKTSDTPAQPLLESFIFEICRARK
jgi:DNA polymerase-3 subunit delta